MASIGSEVTERGARGIMGLLGSLTGGLRKKAVTAGDSAARQMTGPVTMMDELFGATRPTAVAPTSGFRPTINRLAGSFLGSPVKSKLRGAAGIGLGLGALGLGRSLAGAFNTPDQPIMTSPTGPTVAQQLLGTPSVADALKELYASPAFTQQLTAPNYAAQVAATNAQAAKSLEDYLTKVQGMGAGSAKAIADAYSSAAKETAALGETQQVRGQDLAATIDRLYQDLGLAEAELAAGGGVSGEPTQLTGLVPMGGEAATAQQTTPTYGASLADYLGREGTIGGQALAQQALSQAEQGAGTATGLQNMIALAGAQQRFAGEQAGLDRLSQAQMADAEAARQLEAMRLQMQQDQASRLFEATQADAERRRAAEQAILGARANAEYVWDNATGALRAQLEKAYGKGQAGRINFRAAATENPTLIDRFLQ